ncbi:MAG: cell wall hydrolase [Desulfosporosinus fructosivorans]
MCLFLWQACIFPALGQGSANESGDPINKNISIVVQRGETLWELAQSHQTTVDEIVKLNKIKSPNNIREGQSLWVPSRVLEEKPKKIEDIMVTDYAIEPSRSWWVNALRRRIVQVESLYSQASSTQLRKSIIPTFEIFVNRETPEPDPPLNVPHVSNVIDEVQKLAALKPTSIGTESQILSRSLGRLVSKEDVELLTRVIHGEARGENFEGQVAVGAVVLNRLKDPRFPKTIRAVVYQDGAFTAVNDKQIHLDPNDQSYKAAEAALAGQDPTNGALFYFNPSIATDRWIKSRAVVKRIGNHTFSI